MRIVDGQQLGSLEFCVTDYLPGVHPFHEDKVGSDRGQLLTLSEMFMHHVRQHSVPGEIGVSVGLVREFVATKETGGQCWQLMAPEVGKYMRLEGDNIVKDVLAVEDLERAPQIGVLMVAKRHLQHSILRLEDESVSQYATGHSCVDRAAFG